MVAASEDHQIFRGKPTFKDLTRYRWALQLPGAPTRAWLDHAFDRKRLPRPTDRKRAPTFRRPCRG